MERIISYDELPRSKGQSVHLRMETDPKLYISLLGKGYKIVNNVFDTDESTIYITGVRQIFGYDSAQAYKEALDIKIQDTLKKRGITKPKTVKFSYQDLIDNKYQIPFVLKNENINGGREKFLIATEDDYDNLINACMFLLDRNLLFLAGANPDNDKAYIDYDMYLDTNFTVQEYIETPSKYNTTVRLLTTPSHDLLYASLKYNEPGDYLDNTTFLGYLLHNIFPLSTRSIVSNTLSGGENILIGEDNYTGFERSLLDSHNITSNQFEELIDASEEVHETCDSELGIICGFDYIFDQERKEWFMLEYHSAPMVGDYSKRNGISYHTYPERKIAEGRVRATALNKVLKKTR